MTCYIGSFLSGMISGKKFECYDQNGTEIGDSSGRKTKEKNTGHEEIYGRVGKNGCIIFQYPYDDRKSKRKNVFPSIRSVAEELKIGWSEYG